MSIIQGNKFKALTSLHFAPPFGVCSNTFARSDYRYLVNTVDFRKLSDNDIIYTHTFFIKELFDKLRKTDKQVTVVSHNADTPAELIPPDNVKYWYTTNVNIQHERVRSIPIGLENDIWFPEKKRMIQDILKVKKDYPKMLYMNHNIATNYSKRQRPYDVLGSQLWVTTFKGMNGQGIKEYVENIYHHPFVVCPEGNGIDTHRVWECLYLNTIPVQIRNINNQFYTDLPILFIDDWEELNEKFLMQQFMRISKIKWNYEKLNFEFWSKRIKNG